MDNQAALRRLLDIGTQAHTHIEDAEEQARQLLEAAQADANQRAEQVCAEAEKTARLARGFVERARDKLSGEDAASMVILRGRPSTLCR